MVLGLVEVFPHQSQSEMLEQAPSSGNCYVSLDQDSQGPIYIVLAPS